MKKMTENTRSSKKTAAVEGTNIQKKNGMILFPFE